MVRAYKNMVIVARLHVRVRRLAWRAVIPNTGPIAVVVRAGCQHPYRQDGEHYGDSQSLQEAALSNLAVFGFPTLPWTKPRTVRAAATARPTRTCLPSP